MTADEPGLSDRRGVGWMTAACAQCPQHSPTALAARPNHGRAVVIHLCAVNSLTARTRPGARDARAELSLSSIRLSGAASQCGHRSHSPRLVKRSSSSGWWHVQNTSSTLGSDAVRSTATPKRPHRHVHGTRRMAVRVMKSSPAVCRPCASDVPPGGRLVRVIHPPNGQGREVALPDRRGKVPIDVKKLAPTEAVAVPR